MAFDASENTGVTCFQNGELTYGNFGTSLSSPCWAGLIAIVNQGRVADGGTTLNSGSNPTQTLQALYSLPAGDFHDITSGYNGFNAGPGYDDSHRPRLADRQSADPGPGRLRCSRPNWDDWRLPSSRPPASPRAVPFLSRSPSRMRPAT